MSAAAAAAAGDAGATLHVDALQPGTTLDLATNCYSVRGDAKLVYGDVTVKGDRFNWCRGQLIVE
ncbi:MAG TPA: hypothetical protein VFK80_00805, partial [Limnochordia bacterium]|nr:hypothetical protein [Limnochordia bacterium]